MATILFFQLNPLNYKDALLKISRIASDIGKRYDIGNHWLLGNKIEPERGNRMEGKDIRRIGKEILKWSMEKLARELGVALARLSGFSPLEKIFDTGSPVFSRGRSVCRGLNRL